MTSGVWEPSLTVPKVRGGLASRASPWFGAHLNSRFARMRPPAVRSLRFVGLLAKSAASLIRCSPDGASLGPNER